MCIFSSSIRGQIVSAVVVHFTDVGCEGHYYSIVGMQRESRLLVLAMEDVLVFDVPLVLLDAATAAAVAMMEEEILIAMIPSIVIKVMLGAGGVQVSIDCLTLVGVVMVTGPSGSSQAGKAE